MDEFPLDLLKQKNWDNNTERGFKHAKRKKEEEVTCARKTLDWLVSIQFGFSALFLSVNFLVGFMVWYISYSETSTAVEDLLGSIKASITGDITAKSITFLNAPFLTLPLMNTSVAFGATNRHLSNLMLTIIKNHHSIKFVTFCDFNGEFKGYTRDVDMTLYAMNLDQSDNSIKYEEITNSQPESGSIQFSTPFDSEIYCKPRESSANPEVATHIFGVITNKDIKAERVITASQTFCYGTSACTTFLMGLSTAEYATVLSKVAVLRNGLSYILEKPNRTVCADSVGNSGFNLEDHPVEIIKESGTVLSDATLAKVFDPTSAENRYDTEFTYKLETYYLSLQLLQLDLPLELALAILIRKQDAMGFLGDIQRDSLTFSTLIVVTLLPISIVITGIVAQPIKAVTRKMKRIAELKFDYKKGKIFTLDGCERKLIFSELRSLRESYKQMQAGLISFSKYADRKLVRKLIKGEETPKIGMQAREMTVMFMDIIGFTSLCEQLATKPNDLNRIQCDFFQRTTKIIQKYKGTVDKYIGDCVMAFWSAPEPVEDHAALACHAAVQLQYAFADLNKRWMKELDTPFLKAGIGISTGVMYVGNMGYKHRLSYTVAGNLVNTAQRLEKMTRKLNVKILVHEGTQKACVDTHRLLFRCKGAHKLRGKSEDVVVYELYGDDNYLLSKLD